MISRIGIVSAAHAGLTSLLARTDRYPDASLGDAWRDRRTTDILTHVHAWHLLLEGWLVDDAAGRPVHYPAEGYTWAMLGELNDRIYDDLRALDYAEARARLVASHARAVALVESLSTEQLTQPHAYAWLGDEAMANVAHECLGAHYAWGERVLDAAGIA
ncbi:ClbS/DfsB family four-helix bundle protein [Demequina sp. SYSU T00039]|uniref:ClbS/DfsB family four-helix bundle protein n=1 Tax=Demequina lignilytica TaxID=3051663 RepID=A0AAW7M1D3_9MICO|nr:MULTISPECIES: ClbS/DfsB family four-helix bundle protein [unclassified Demequina]MDN4478324.1 ClbS/DfsB family four-helix bundle protein [Demequina sp. SYSU T00039-1]MDN4487169.1 ClbS/DfsB family four-helix bundle protein [Demequina sp. SYSU T00039]MDN4489880.1 ClbS/DfsB family four-helix bundle protein [Demequina sp. SYSU T00068]